MPRDFQVSGRSRSPRLLDAAALWDYSLKLLAGRSMSIGEVREKLRRRAAEHGDIDGVLQRLKETGCLNDAQFAEGFALARKDSGGFGRMRVLRDLRQRRVAPGLASEVVQETYKDSDETEMIESFLKRKFRTVNLPEHLQDPRHLRSVYRKLRYAGFGVGPSIRVLKRYAAQAEELEAEEDQSQAEP